MRQYPTQGDKTERAFRAYVDLIDAGEWLKGELRVPLESVDLTMGEFRVLELLNREGAINLAELGRRRKAKPQNMQVLVDRLTGRGWLRRRRVRLAPVGYRGSKVPRSRRDGPRVGQWAILVSLSKSGKNFMAHVLPRHSKLVKSLMRVLDAREQDSLSRICRKLVAGDVMKFVHEITMEDGE
ncbi:MAG TPA: MarR family transcriptional regulator [Candidatus Acidoferrales bacterium]|jgi:DNA-binding MarR family transcriptional regulator|nr:MarR family transcriptional regulator [Candidatus Acidoferrales bacterium]